MESNDAVAPGLAQGAPVEAVVPAVVPPVSPTDSSHGTASTFGHRSPEQLLEEGGDHEAGGPSTSEEADQEHGGAAAAAKAPPSPAALAVPKLQLDAEDKANAPPFMLGGYDDGNVHCFGGRKYPRRPLGFCLALAGAALLVLTGILQATFPSIYRSQLKAKLVVTNMREAKAAPMWLSNKGAATASHVTFYFYNLTNAHDFLHGEKPHFTMMGPYVYRTFYQRVDLVFSPDKDWLEFATKHQAFFLPQLSVGPQSEPVTIFNLGYATGVARKRSESNMLRSAVRTLLRMHRTGATSKLPADMGAMVVGGWGERQGDLATLAKKLRDALGADQFNQRFASNGFQGAAVTIELEQTLAVAPDMASYYQTLLDVSELAGSEPLSVAQAVQLLEPTNDKGLTFVNQPNQPRHGLLAWLQQPLPASLNTAAAGLTAAQVKGLAAYARRVSTSPKTVARILEVTGLATEADGNIYKTAEDLVMRQWSVADVLARLGQLEGAAGDKVMVGTPISAPANGAPYVDSGDMWELGAYLRQHRSLAVDYLEAGFNVADKGRCILDALVSNKTYYETEVLGIPREFAVHADFTHHDATDSVPVTHPLQGCLDTANKQGADWQALQGFVTYLALTAAKPVFENLVIKRNGGLVATRPVKEWVLGHVEPLLPLALGKDSPAAMSYNILPNAPEGLDGGASWCISAADMSNPGSACVLDSQHSNSTHQAYRRIRQRYLTGAKDLNQMLALERYDNQSVFNVLGVDTHISGGARGLPGSRQWGFSTGEQWPPLMLSKGVTNATSLYLMRVKGPMIFKFDFERDVDHLGVTLKRFTFDKKAVFTSQRDGEHFLNATLVNMAPLFISTDPRAGLSPKELDSKALGGEAHHDCMLGVEPITGRTLKMRIPTQLSCSLTDHTSGELDVFYKGAYKAAMVPYAFVVQETVMADADARHFKRMVYLPRTAAQVAIINGFVFGSLLLLAGLIVLSLAPRRIKGSSTSSTSSSLPATILPQ